MLEIKLFRCQLRLIRNHKRIGNLTLIEDLSVFIEAQAECKTAQGNDDIITCPGGEGALPVDAVNGRDSPFTDDPISGDALTPVNQRNG
ncbi:hypothetical protein GJ496_001247 [Pomphorhynchus laevis]|nr:hypothetical protein GJ496_001247 [Pomphorhynchus laevis]